MSEASSVSSMLTYSLKSLFRASGNVQPQPDQDVQDSGRFDRTLADLAASSQENVGVATPGGEIGSPVRSDKDPVTPSTEKNPAKVRDSGYGTQGTEGTRLGHPALTWQLVSSTTDIEQNEDMVQTAALPLKGYRIYSEAANKGE